MDVRLLTKQMKIRRDVDKVRNSIYLLLEGNNRGQCVCTCTKMWLAKVKIKYITHI